MIEVLIVAIALVTLILIVIRVRSEQIINRIWRSLQAKSTTGIFKQEMVANLPEPVQRYFLHAIAPETPLSSSVELELTGSLRLEPDTAWIVMKGKEMLAVPGFVWKATIGRNLIRLIGADYYSKGLGGIQFFLWGLIPVFNDQNAQINRSCIGRLAAEYVWLPSALLPQNDVTWQVIDECTIQASLKIENEPVTLTLTIDNNGKLLTISLPRWGVNTDSGNWEYIPFGGKFQAEQTFNGFTIPSKMSASWWFDKDQYFEFFRAEIEQVNFH